MFIRRIEWVTLGENKGENKLWRLKRRRKFKEDESLKKNKLRNGSWCNVGAMEEQKKGWGAMLEPKGIRRAELADQISEVQLPELF